MSATITTATAPARTRTIGDVMTPQPYTIGRHQTLATARAMMQSHKLRHLPVLEHGQLVGVVTERDLETIASVSLHHDRMDDAMVVDVYSVAPDEPLTNVVKTMSDRKIGCVVVVERDRVAGIFTATDALRLLSEV